MWAPDGESVIAEKVCWIDGQVDSVLCELDGQVYSVRASLSGTPC